MLTNNRRTMYKDTYATVITPDGDTDNFKITKGVLRTSTSISLCDHTEY